MTYTHATFSERLDPLSMYENWRDVPAEVRAAVVSGSSRSSSRLAA